MTPPNAQAGFSRGITEITPRKASGKLGDSSLTRRYFITGAEDEYDAMDLLGAGIPSVIAGMVPATPDIEEVCHLTGSYIGTVRYAVPDSPEAQREKENAWPPAKLVEVRVGDSCRWTWRTQATQFQIFGTSPAKVSHFGDPAKKRDFQGAINVDPDDRSVGGTNRYFFGEEWTAEKVFAKSSITNSWLDAVRAARGTVNQNSFAVTAFTTSNPLSFPALSVLFLGTEGTEEEDGVRVRFSFVMGTNELDVAVGGVTGITKNAHDFLWPLWESTTDDNNFVVRQAAGVYVHQLYDPADWSALSELLE